jgi:benzoyl-CoA reductase/2-hydroxyglutaryl-CoA dehydratase subunit BcrC/BadD/HgdB
MKRDLANHLQQLTDQNVEDLERSKTSGRSVIGFYCLYSPMEIAVAAGAIPLPLCGTRNDPIAAAENILRRNLCPLIKSSFGFAVTDTCPFFRFSDIIIGDTTCDGKKKIFELLSRY